MSPPAFTFVRVARNPVGWAALASLTCLTAFSISTSAPVAETLGWAVASLVVALHLLRTPVTWLRLDRSGLTLKQGRHPTRRFAYDDIRALHHLQDKHGPGLLNILLQDGRSEAVTLLELPPPEDLEHAAKSHGLPFLAL